MLENFMGRKNLRVKANGDIELKQRNYTMIVGTVLPADYIPSPYERFKSAIAGLKRGTDGIHTQGPKTTAQLPTPLPAGVLAHRRGPVGHPFYKKGDKPHKS